MQHDDVEETNSDTPKNQNAEKKKKSPSSSALLANAGDESFSENSFGGDFLGIFRGYLRGQGSAEDTRRRLKMNATANEVNNGALHPGIKPSIYNHHLTGDESSVVKPTATIKTTSIDNPQFASSSSCSSWLTAATLLRTLLLDLPLAILFAAFLAAWMIRNIHDTYYEPLFDRATRTDAQLLEEFTYYERQCTKYDLTTRNIQDMLLPIDTTISSSKDDVIDTAVETMMIHGATVIPSVLQPNTTAALRDYIVRKNARISAAEAYPMSQGENRLSYGIDASEDPAVSQAIAEVATHPVIRPLLRALLGDDDPASAEITSITAFAGAEDQVWHQDTKQDGKENYDKASKSKYVHFETFTTNLRHVSNHSLQATQLNLPVHILIHIHSFCHSKTRPKAWVRPTFVPVHTTA